MLTVNMFEGGLMVSRPQRRDDALGFACCHLEEYLETSIRAKTRAEKS